MLSQYRRSLPLRRALPGRKLPPMSTQPPESSEPPKSDSPVVTGAPGPRSRTAVVDLSRTWEMEILISGAVLFALLHLPVVVDAWFARAGARLAGGKLWAATMAFIYLKLILYALIGTFGGSLAARGWWVALVGLDSVFPAGIVWDKLRAGPYAKADLRRHLRPLDEMIRRADDFCTTLFASGMLTAMTFVLSVLAVAACGLLTWGISRVLGGRFANLIFFALLAIVAGGTVLVRTLDRLLGERVPPDSAFGRFLARASGWTTRVTGARLLAPTFVLATNVSPRRFAVASTGVLVALAGFMVVHDVLIPAGAVHLDSYVYLPDDAPGRQVSPQYYEDQRDPDRVYRYAPAIQSRVVEGPYLRLFLPLPPQRLDPAVEERCPDVPRLTGSGAEPPEASEGTPDLGPFLACLGRLQPVTLDGAPLDDIRWHLSVREGSGVRGVLAMIPVRDLPDGEHTLRIGNLPRPKKSRRPPRKPFVIPFWR